MRFSRALCIWVWALLLVYSVIRVSGQGISVTSVFVQHDVPWSRVRSIKKSGPLEIVLRDGTVVGSVQFGEALLGEIFGYRTHRRHRRLLQERLDRARRDRLDEVPGSYRKRWVFPAVPVLLAAAGFLLCFSIMFFADVMS